MERPTQLAEGLWDAEKSAPKWDDIGAAVTERDALKAQAAERAAKIPATPDAYAFNLPDAVKLPDGFRWEADAKDPLVVATRELAAKNNWTQDEVSDLVGLYAQAEIAKQDSLKAFAAEQTKQLGEKAEVRRTAARTFIDSVFKKDDPQGEMLRTILEYAPGVGAIETLMGKMSGIDLRGTGNDQQADKNAEMKENIGKPGMGLKLINQANSAK